MVQIFRFINSSSEHLHLRNEQYGEHFLSQLWVFNRASKANGNCSARHGQRVVNSIQDAKRELEANHKIRDNHLQFGKLRESTLRVHIDVEDWTRIFSYRDQNLESRN